VTSSGERLGSVRLGMRTTGSNVAEESTRSGADHRQLKEYTMSSASRKTSRENRDPEKVPLFPNRFRLQVVIASATTF
jgi:hypothetical protein